MANDPSRSLPGVETEPAGPNQTPYSGFPGYEEFRVGDPIPGMPGSFVGGEIVNNAGDRWNWVKGEWETAGQPVDLSTPPTPKFGPVTASGYAQPPVDPLSYYSTPEPTPAPTPYTGGPTRWTEVYRPTVDLSNIQTFTPAPNPVSTPTPQPTPSPVSQEATYSSEGEDSGISLITNENRDRYIKEGTMDLQQPPVSTVVNPLPETGIPKAEDVDTNTFTGVVTNPVQGGEKPYYVENTGSPGTVEDKSLTAGLIPLDKPQITFQTATTLPTSTARVPVTATNRQSIIRPFNMPTEVPIPPRRTVERLAPGYFQDVNYDPDEILAAAMRVLRGRGAGRSLME
jgi:hypothetical protein